MSKRRTKVDEWLDRETPHKKKALENASRYFDSKDSLSVNILEAIYGQESSFGSNRRTRGIAGAAGDFQIEKETAIRYGLAASKKNDQRFDIDDASKAAKNRKPLKQKTSAEEHWITKDGRHIPIED